MDDADKIVLQAEIERGIPCALNHGKNQAQPQAIMHLCQQWGYNESDTVSVSVRSITIPICQECYEALQGQEWALLMCKRCGSSQWVDRARSRKQFLQRITWTEACPHCAGINCCMGENINSGCVL